MMQKVFLLILFISPMAFGGSTPVKYFFMYGNDGYAADFTGQKVESAYVYFPRLDQECGSEMAKVIDLSVKQVAASLEKKQTLLSEDLGSPHSLEVQYRIEVNGAVYFQGKLTPNANKCILSVQVRERPTNNEAEISVLLYDRKNHMFLLGGGAFDDQGQSKTDAQKLTQATNAEFVEMYRGIKENLRLKASRDRRQPGGPGNIQH